jgi:hypothetical protein
MEIIENKGKKAEGDIRYNVNMDNEAFSIIKFCVLNNKLAKNEYNLHKESIEKHDRFFFKEAMVEAIDMGKEGIDFKDWLNKKENFDAWCDKYCFASYRKRKAWKEIISEIQVTIEEAIK